MRHGDPRIRLLLQVLDGAFTARGWQGATLSGALRGLAPRQALWRPGAGRHNIWELVLHTAFWKHAVRQRVEAGPGRERFPRPGRNFPRLPERCDAAAWRADVALLKQQHELLKGTVRRLPRARLDSPVGRSRWTAAEQIFGVAAHDLYHAGQIQLLKALQRRRAR
jgi:hypothetical protein